MAREQANRIRLHGRDDDRREAIAAGTISPGYLVEVDGVSTGVDPDPELVPHGTAAQVAQQVAFAVEYSATGMGIEDDYESGDEMYYFVGLPGDRFLAVHNTAEDVAFGDEVVSAGDGTVRALDTVGGDAAGAVIGEAREAVTNSSDTAATLFTVEVF